MTNKNKLILCSISALAAATALPNIGADADLNLFETAYADSLLDKYGINPEENVIGGDIIELKPIEDDITVGNNGDKVPDKQDPKPTEDPAIKEAKDKLKNLVEQAKKDYPKKDAEKYTPEYFDKLWNDISNGEDVLGREEPTLSDLNKAYNQLDESMKNPVRRSDFTKLEDAINRANEEAKKPDYYGNEGVAEIKDGIEKAQKVLDDKNSPQNDVDKATKDLNDLLDNLKEAADANLSLEESRDALAKEIKKAEALSRDGKTPSSVKKLDDAIKSAKDELNNDKATVPSLNAERAKLISAESLEDQADKEQLKKDIKEAEELLKNPDLKDGTSLEKILDYAKKIDDDLDATQAEVNEASSDLRQAINDANLAIDKEREARKRKEDLENAKKAAKEEIDKLPNLTDEEKDGFKNRVDEATEKEQIKPIVDEAKELNDSRAKDLEKAKRDAKRVIEALPYLDRDEKYAYQDRIDDDVETIEAIKPIVDEAIKLNDERAKADELQKYKEAAIARVNESTLPDDVKQGFVDRINAAESKEAVDEIMAEFDALNAEHKALLEAKRAAKEAIENLANLPDDVKAELKGRVDAAKTIPEVEAILDEARELDNKYANEADFNKFKENAKAAIDKLPNLTDEEKAGFKSRIDEAKDKQEVQNILDEARDLNNLRQQDINQNKANEALVDAVTDAINKLQGQNKEENDKTIAILQQLLEKVNNGNGITSEDLDSFKAELLKGLKSIDFSGGIDEEDINKIVLAIKDNKVDIDLSNLATHDDISNQTEQFIIAIDRLTKAIESSNEASKKLHEELMNNIKDSNKNINKDSEDKSSAQTIDQSLLNRLRDAYFDNRVEARALEELISKTPKTVKPFKARLESQLTRSKALTNRAKAQLDKYDTQDKSTSEKALEDAIFENKVQARAVEILLEENPETIKGYKSRFEKVLQESNRLTDKGNIKLRELRNKREGSKTASLSSMFFTKAYASSDFDSSAAEDLINELDSSTDDMKNLRNEVENSGEEETSTEEKDVNNEEGTKDNTEIKETDGIITSDSDQTATEEVRYTSGLSSESASTNASNGQANHNSKTGIGSVLGSLGVLGGASALLYGLKDKKKKNRD